MLEDTSLEISLEEVLNPPQRFRPITEIDRPLNRRYAYWAKVVL